MRGAIVRHRLHSEVDVLSFIILSIYLQFVEAKIPQFHCFANSDTISVRCVSVGDVPAYAVNERKRVVCAPTVWETNVNERKHNSLRTTVYELPVNAEHW